MKVRMKRYNSWASTR